MIEAEIVPRIAALEVPAVIDGAEEQLVDEIGNLWQVHSQAQTSLRKTRNELRLTMTDLSQRLFELKSVLSRPGRGGAWSSFLQAKKIPRSTADRLVRNHAKTISADPDSCTTEHIKEPTEVVVCRYFHALWPKLSKVLKTHEAVEVFVAELRYKAETAFEGQAVAPALESGIPPLITN
jgi:hypothetical protein